MKKYIYLSILGIVIGELMMLSGDVYYGLGIHIINLMTIILYITSRDRDMSQETKNALSGLTLILLFRVINLATPKIFVTTLLWYPLIYGVLFLSIYLIIKDQQIPIKELGITSNRLIVYLPIAIIIGIIIAIVEYQISHPKSLIENITVPNVILISIVMIIFIGTAEELMFRSILQTRFEKVFGLKYGLLLTAGIFAVVNTNYGIVGIIFAGIFGIILGYIFQKTRSIPFTITVRGIENIILFGILPIILPVTII